MHPLDIILLLNTVRFYSDVILHLVFMLLLSHVVTPHCYSVEPVDKSHVETMKQSFLQPHCSDVIVR